MPEYSTLPHADRPKKRPIIDHAGEVTKKAQATKPEASADQPPPAFTKKKIGGAINFLGPEVATLRPGSTAQDAGISSIPGVAVASSQPPLATAYSQELVLAEPPGWKSFWTDKLSRDNEDLPDVLVSRFCKHCLKDEIACGQWAIGMIRRGFQWTCRECAAEGRLCTRLVSFRLPDNIAVDKIFETRPRRLAELYFTSLDTDMEVITYTRHQSEIPGLPYPPDWWVQEMQRRQVALGLLNSRDHSPSNAAKPRAGPTFSRVQDAYEELTEHYYHERTLRAADQDSEFEITRHDRPFWETAGDLADSRYRSVPDYTDVPRPFSSLSDFHEPAQSRAHESVQIRTYGPPRSSFAHILSPSRSGISDYLSGDSSEGAVHTKTLSDLSRVEIESSSSVSAEPDEDISPKWRQVVAMKRRSTRTQPVQDTGNKSQASEPQNLEQELRRLMQIACKGQELRD